VLLDQFRDGIRRYGWVITGVGEDGRCSAPGCTSPHRPEDPFTYTVGLTAAGLPELLLEHVLAATAARALNALARESLGQELDLEAVHRLAELPGLLFTLVPVVGAHRCEVARALYAGRVRVLRVTPHWPGQRVER
jgi:hypothetical protein